MRVFGILGVVIALCVGLFMYKKSIEEIPEGNPVQQIDTVRRLQIDGDRFLAAVHPNEMRCKAVDDVVVVSREITALRVFDFYHPGAEVG